MPGPINGDWTSWENLAQIAGGVGATLTGQPYNIYRITATGDVIQPANLIFSNFPIVRGIYKPGKQNRLETDKAFAALWENINTDFSTLRVGDIFVQTDPFFGAGYTAVTYGTDQINAVCFAARPPGAPAIGARLDRLCQIFRAPGTPNAQGVENQTLDGAQALICTTGVFALGVAGAGGASNIPIGFLPEKRARGETYKEVGDVPQMTMMKAYVPPLNGFRFRTNDMIIMSDASRLRVVNPYYQETGVMGSQLILQREVDNL